MANKRGQGEGSISKRPDGTWWARITLGKDDNGKQKRKAFYGSTRKEVQEKLTAALSDMNDGVYIDPSRMPLEQWLNTWLVEYKKNFIRPQTYRGYYGVTNNHIIPTLGKYALKDIRPDMVQKFINSLSDRPSSAARSLEVLSGALGQAFKNDLIKRNVASGIILPKVDRPQKVILTNEEQPKFIEATKNSHYGNIFVLILGTGLRIGEALALTWEDIDCDADILRVNKTFIYAKDHDDPTSKFQRSVNPPKTKASNRSVPLLPSIRDMLKALKETQRNQWRIMGLMHKDNNFVFCNFKGEMWLHSTVNEDFKKVVNQAGLNPKLTIHGLRHTFATRGLENGIPLKVMQEILGHSSLKMTADLYTHVLPETKKGEIIKLADTVTVPEGTSVEHAVLPVLGVECRKCGGTEIVRNGIYRGKQRYLCKKCGYKFIEREALGVTCIHCNGVSVVKNGKTSGGRQCYLCTKCNRRFAERDNQAERVDALEEQHYEQSNT